VTNAGGTGAIAADESERRGLDVSPLGRKTLRALEGRFRNASFMQIVSLNNPLDLTATATTSEFIGVAKMVVASGDYDMMVIFPTHQPPTIDYSIVERTVEVAKSERKPIVVCTMGTSDLANMLHKEYLGRGVPSFRDPQRAVGALAALAEYHDLRRHVANRSTVSATDRAPGLQKRKGLLMEPDASALLSSYGIPSAKSVVLTSTRGISKLKGRLAFPVACKLMSKDLVHKTDLGGVILNVKSEGQVESAFRSLAKLARDSHLELDGVLVQEMVRGGIELILGGLRDGTFGPSVLLGLGGVYTEVIKDYAVAVAPVSPSEALGMISSLKTSPLLHGHRGGVHVDLQNLAEVISRFSRIQVENPSIRELEVNPLIATEIGVSAVDTRILLG